MKETCSLCRYYHDADHKCYLFNKETTPIKSCSKWKGYMYE